MNRKLLSLFVISIFLFGCAHGPELLGISDLEWSSYSEEKQKRLLDNYNKIAKEREAILAEQDNKDSNSVFLLVSMHDGKIMLPPSFINWQRYRPVKFEIFKGQCRDIEVTHSSDKNIKTKLGICYRDNILYLDPSRYEVTKEMGTVSIPFSPLWVTGFAYKGINSNGYVGLSDVTVEIKQKEESFVNK